MNSRLSVLSLALLSMVSALAPGRVVAASSEPSAVRIRVVILDARLRSAFIQRATGLDRFPPPATFAARQRELRDHFDAVLALLVANTARSLDTALDRLEQRRGEEWSEVERATWRQRLAEERLTNIRRLHRYQQRGRFPINEHASDRAVPVFVDNYDTACAVGHLMRESGWKDAVSTIQATNNLVYVTDVSDGPVVDWVVTSGLTQEEAALIQPAYQPPPFDATFQQLMAGGTISLHGLRYENFRTAGVPQFDPSVIGVAALDQFYTSPDGAGYAGHFENWAFIGAPGYGIGGFGSTLPGEHRIVEFAFDVVATNPRALIAAATLESVANFNFNLGDNISVLALVSDPDDQSLLATLQVSSADSDSYYLNDYDELAFAPQEKISVTTLVELNDWANFTSLTYSFEVVPEPSSIAIFVIGNLAAMCWGRRQRQFKGLHTECCGRRFLTANTAS